MSSKQPDYLSYLLRLWRDDGNGPNNWRASLESALTGERHVFPSLMELYTFLERQTVTRCDADEDKRGMGAGSPQALE